MGNRLCKKKGEDAVDNAKNVNSRDGSPSKFDRIITRLHLKPTAWKSESNLDKKQSNNNRSKSAERPNGESIFYTKPISKSSDWTEVDLEVPSKEDEHIHLRNPKLNLIFDNDKGTPTPPPRKQQKGSNFREKIEKIATKSLQALQGDKNKDTTTNQVPVEEPLVVQKKINYRCPQCDKDEKNHNRDHHHHHDHIKPTEKDSPKKVKNIKRQKNLSVVSLPNYTDLKLSVAHPNGSVDKTSAKGDLNSSRLSLQHPSSKKITSSQSTGKLDSYITRCRSLGSLLPQQLKKLKLQKTKPEVVTSDDSFGPLEDWDVGLIEHYNPKDASLPRPRKPALEKSDKAIMDGIESLIVKEEDMESPKPERPVRIVESLVKKTNADGSNNTQSQLIAKSPEDICLTPPPSPIHGNKVQVLGAGKKVAELTKNFEDPAAIKPEINLTAVKPTVIRRNKDDKKSDPKDDVKRESVAEHSSLMKILQEFSLKDKQEKGDVNVENESDLPSLTPSLVEFERNLNNNVVEDFINAEKSYSKAVYS